MNTNKHTPEHSNLSAQAQRELSTSMKEALGTTRLPNETREKTRAFLSEYASMNPVRTPQVTEHRSFIQFVHVSIMRPVPALAAALIFFVSGGTALAAEGALPGDLLYPVKVGVNEQVRSALAISTEAQGAWEVERAERRLEEASRLAAAGTLDDDTRAEIETRLEAHTKAAEATAEKLAADDDVAEAAEIEARLAAAFSVHADALRSIRERSSSLVRAQLDSVLARVDSATTRTIAAAPTPHTASTDMATMSLSVDAQTERQGTARTATEVSGPVVSESAAERLREAAQKRIESSEAHVKRIPETLTHRDRAVSALDEAQAKYAEGKDALEDANYDAAAEHFKAALDAAITAETTLRVYLRLDSFDIRVNGSATNDSDAAKQVDDPPTPDSIEITSEPARR